LPKERAIIYDAWSYNFIIGSLVIDGGWHKWVWHEFYRTDIYFKTNWQTIKMYQSAKSWTFDIGIAQLHIKIRRPPMIDIRTPAKEEKALQELKSLSEKVVPVINKDGGRYE